MLLGDGYIDILSHCSEGRPLWMRRMNKCNRDRPRKAKHRTHTREFRTNLYKQNETQNQTNKQN